MDTQPPDQTRLIRQALADLVFGIALFAIFILLGMFGAKQAASAGTPLEVSTACAQGDRPQHIALPLERET